MPLDYTKIGKRLRLVRNELTQEAFAKSLGVSASYVKKTELGGKPSLEYLMNIALTYHISLDWLLVGLPIETGNRLSSTLEPQVAENKPKQIPWVLYDTLDSGNAVDPSAEPDNNKFDSDFEYMVTILNHVMNSDNPDLRSWAKIQFCYAFYPYIEKHNLIGPPWDFQPIKNK